MTDCKKKKAESLFTWNSPFLRDSDKNGFKSLVSKVVGKLVLWPVCQCCGDTAWESVSFSVMAKETFSTFRFHQMASWPQWVKDRNLAV